jgi:hypothetical protein
VAQDTFQDLDHTRVMLYDYYTEFNELVTAGTVFIL